MGDKQMDFIKTKVSGVMTVEAGLVMSIILLIILYQTDFSLQLYVKVQDYGRDCVKSLKESADSINSMRLTRFALKWVGKE